MSLTASKTIYRTGFQPMMPGVFFAPYAYCYRCPKAVPTTTSSAGSPPLTINEEHLEEGLTIFERALEKTAKR